MTPDEIRRSFLNHMGRHGSIAIPAANILPENDPTTLFVGSGMQPMIPYLLGMTHPVGRDLANVQPCVRTGDIDEVGDLTHLTFFEMIGRWELGADTATYKKAQIARIADWQIHTLGLDPKRLFVSVYAGNDEIGIKRDDECIGIWKELFARYDIDAPVELEPFKFGASRGGRIFVYGDGENWWSRSGTPKNMPIGEPGGPDSEMFFDFEPNGDQMAHPAEGGSRFVEIGNNVFMSYKKTTGGFTLLDSPNIDYGGGLERIFSAAVGEKDVFKTPFFATVVKELEALSKRSYDSHTREFRIILDHARAATFLCASGALPGNRDAGYIVRRLIRRAARVGHKLRLEGPFLAKLSEIFIRESTAYSFVQEKGDSVIAAIQKEEQAFQKTLIQGEKEIRRFLEKSEVTGKDAFFFYETYGFPLELTKEVLEEEGQTLKDEESFHAAQVAHSELSKTASAGKFAGGLADHSETTTAYHTTTHLLLAGLQSVLGPHVHQMGSNITPSRLRFDFSHPQKMTTEELNRVVEFVNDAIRSSAEVSVREMAKSEAMDVGIEGSFWEKYPDRVTVYSIRDDGGKLWSEELCGGPHVSDMSQLRGLGKFTILKEESSSSGVRRIKARLDA
jgi:alanyl-tRNA synthetase